MMIMICCDCDCRCRCILNLTKKEIIISLRYLCYLFYEQFLVYIIHLYSSLTKVN